MAHQRSDLKSHRPSSQDDSIQSSTHSLNPRHDEHQSSVSLTDRDGRTTTTEPHVEEPQPDEPAFEKEAEENYKPKTLKFWLVILSTLASLFLVALDRTIISTAIPAITDEFDSLGDIGWYGSSYMLTTACFLLVFGRVYRFYDMRWTFLCCILVFEIGSAICGAAESSKTFIVGRAVAGLGSAGINTGAMLVIIPMVPLHKRPMFQSLFGLVFGVSAITGPLIGGAFTETATWRWCFYMNLPIGAVAAVCLFVSLKSPPRPAGEQATLGNQLMRLDPLGTFFFLPSIVCLLLALQWGGTTYDWDSWRIILLLVMFVLTLIAFAVVQVTMPDTATLPLRIIKQRSVLAGTIFILFLSGSMLVLVYYIPLWFQTTHGVKPVDSGIYTIPLVLSLVVGNVISAAVTQRIGYYVPSMIVSSCLMSAGQGLLLTWTPHTGSPEWIGYQVLCGFGIGFGMQTVGLAMQATLPKDDVPTGVSMMFFGQQLGGAIFVSAGQNLLSNGLVDKLAGIPGLDAEKVISAGATDLHNAVPNGFLGVVKAAYNYACTRIFIVGLALSCAGLVAALAMEWKSIKKHDKEAVVEQPGHEQEK